jgi:hypothetical protein
MRAVSDAAKVAEFIAAFGRSAQSPGCVFLTGGATAVLHGWRSTTIDVDLKMDPEPRGAFEAIAKLKDELDINVELASPDQFVPAVPGWRERSIFIGRFGPVDFFHFDPITQALAKLERGDDRDLDDVRAMVARGLVGLPELSAAFEEIRDSIPRYPSIDAAAFEAKVKAFVDLTNRK